MFSLHTHLIPKGHEWQRQAGPLGPKGHHLEVDFFGRSAPLEFLWSFFLTMMLYNEGIDMCKHNIHGNYFLSVWAHGQSTLSTRAPILCRPRLTRSAPPLFSAATTATQTSRRWPSSVTTTPSWTSTSGCKPNTNLKSTNIQINKSKSQLQIHVKCHYTIPIFHTWKLSYFLP